MIASLRGEVISIALDHAVIECAGVGYKFLATPATLGTLVRGGETRVLTAMVVKEDSMTLYGFGSDDDRQMFHTLQKVSGMGAKLAMAALSVMGPEEIANSITGQDPKSLQKIPGVGKRMADRMVLELKDKVQNFSSATAGSVAPAPAQAAGPVVEQVVEALVGLGFTEKAARPVVESTVAAATDTSTAAILRGALSQLGAKK
ncbi:ATP-dependent DNA helicase RuvA [Corynebacterium phocae]|uniref:Holliday junction branch migration complex subunit RuvA n=1 Tax=Corynebacterium phocae TaxID=161895 RepID=A0A1L7D2Q1_9CORY|nr:Holliday junction branch migration protein RuvA [Corynebacterium phocae]APT92419.1 ATP-dependent DNA helicase RuvA [Corynebacterium phocae]KAA8725016.1 Holliday junction branch migration protein RuvA [Corynebacterium phocae]